MTGPATQASLTEASIEWGRRAARPPTLRLTPRDLELFAALDQYRYLTTSMLTLLFWGEGAHPYTAQHRLKLLHDATYIDKFRPRRAPGAQEWIYRLATPGWHTLAMDGVVSGDAPSTGELTYLGYVDHDLQLNALILEIASQIARTDALLHDHLPFVWHGTQAGRIEPGPIPLIHAGGDTSGQALHRECSRIGAIEPDATLRGRHATTGDPVAVLIEYDRTRRPAKQVDRLRRYDWLLADGWRHTPLAAHPYEPAVVFILQADTLLPAFLREADRQLTAWTAHEHAARVEGRYPAREQIAFSTIERLRDGDWEMLQVPALPPTVRRQLGPSSREPGRILFPLPNYFARESTP